MEITINGVLVMTVRIGCIVLEASIIGMECIRNSTPQQLRYRKGRLRRKQLRRCWHDSLPKRYVQETCLRLLTVVVIET